MTQYSDASDEELFRRSQAGDETAFTLLYQRRQGAIYRFALQMSDSKTWAEDVTQETFMVLLREAAHYDSTRGSLAAYLFGIARNLVRRRLERDRLFISLADEAESEELADAAQLAAPTDPLGDLTRRELIEAVRQAVLALPPVYREVVVLCELQEMSYQEVAEALGCALGTVRSRLHRGRGLLLERLRALKAAEAAPPKSQPTRCFV